MKIKTNQKIKWKNLVGKRTKIGMSISQTKDILIGTIIKTRKINGELYIELSHESLEDVKKHQGERSIWVNTKYIVYIFGFR